MASTADFRNGMCLDIEGQFYFIVEFLHVKPGKGPAFVRTKLKNVKTGRVIDKTFNAGVKVDEVRIERRPHQFLYFEGDDCVFMNTEDFEQINLSKDLINGSDFMKEGDTVELIVHAESDTVLYGDMPTHVIMEVTYTEPGLKGDTATNTLKPATVENGANVRVPLFINEGDKIKIDTRDGSYVERIRE
ncbi:MAG: elongation factor P [Paludibacteraceae bacterium]|jgi:elongation factor P|nr:elongation factor P [Paludibacteraceae bacterium]MBO5863647.1 elongation factor P [Paludibacteraceae bacterium]MBO5989049.1 elongation factor P [Paludibacteraceae bacterium]MEE0997841.1 elongation factor P [Paludibacteraceae bacterium]MEE1542048.1 elongation factor P [Paludibacteraceae bacterium]